MWGGNGIISGGNITVNGNVNLDQNEGAISGNTIQIQGNATVYYVGVSADSFVSGTLTAKAVVINNNATLDVLGSGNLSLQQVNDDGSGTIKSGGTLTINFGNTQIRGKNISLHAKGDITIQTNENLELNEIISENGNITLNNTNDKQHTYLKLLETPKNATIYGQLLSISGENVKQIRVGGNLTGGKNAEGFDVTVCGDYEAACYPMSETSSRYILGRNLCHVGGNFSLSPSNCEVRCYENYYDYHDSVSNFSSSNAFNYIAYINNSQTQIKNKAATPNNCRNISWCTQNNYCH